MTLTVKYTDRDTNEEMEKRYSNSFKKEQLIYWINSGLDLNAKSIESIITGSDDEKYTIIDIYGMEQKEIKAKNKELVAAYKNKEARRSEALNSNTSAGMELLDGIYDDYKDTVNNILGVEDIIDLTPEMMV